VNWKRGISKDDVLSLYLKPASISRAGSNGIDVRASNAIISASRPKMLEIPEAALLAAPFPRHAIAKLATCRTICGAHERPDQLYCASAEVVIRGSITR